jgi:hypothetical protein
MKEHPAAITLILFLVLILSTPLFAQDGGAESQDVFGVILYADGEEITIFRHGTLLTYDVLYDDIIGMPLLEGDLVQTENGTFVEVQLLPSRSTLKIAENTSFQINSIAQNGGGDFDLLYGRVRAKVAQLGATDPFQIRGRQAVAGVRGTDFGFDYVVERGSFTNPVTQVYCFEGSVEVLPSEDDSNASQVPDGEAQDPTVAESQGSSTPSESVQTSPAASNPSEAVLISANQMVSLRQSAPEPQSEADSTSEDSGTPMAEQTGSQLSRPKPEVSQTGIGAAINSFWETNNFKTEPVDVQKINQQFPELKVKILQARRDVQLASERRALQQGKVSPEELQNRIRELQLPEPSFADTITALPIVNIESVYPEIQPKILRRNNARTAGLVLSGVGAFSGVSGIIVALWGEQIFETPAHHVDDISIGLLAGAGLTLSIGLPLYFINIIP